MVPAQSSRDLKVAECLSPSFLLSAEHRVDRPCSHLPEVSASSCRDRAASLLFLSKQLSSSRGIRHMEPALVSFASGPQFATVLPTLGLVPEFPLHLCEFSPEAPAQLPSDLSSRHLKSHHSQDRRQSWSRAAELTGELRYQPRPTESRSCCWSQPIPGVGARGPQSVPAPHTSQQVHGVT